MSTEGFDMVDLEIRLDGAGYVARELDPKAAARLITLFGTDTLPLPFLADAQRDRIIGTLMLLNPGIRLTFHGDRLCPVCLSEIDTLSCDAYGTRLLHCRPCGIRWTQACASNTFVEVTA